MNVLRHFTSVDQPVDTRPKKIAEENAGRNNELFIIGEAKLAEKLGIAHKKLAAARAWLQEGRDWCWAGKMVVLSREGLTRLLERLGLVDSIDIEELAGSFEEAKVEGPSGGSPAGTGGSPVPPIEGKVRRFYPNPHLMEVEFADARRVKVRIKKQDNFKPGMAVPIVPEKMADGTDNPDIWMLARKEPRFPGRW